MEIKDVTFCEAHKSVELKFNVKEEVFHDGHKYVLDSVGRGCYPKKSKDGSFVYVYHIHYNKEMTIGDVYYYQNDLGFCIQTKWTDNAVDYLRREWGNFSFGCFESQRPLVYIDEYDGDNCYREPCRKRTYTEHFSNYKVNWHTYRPVQFNKSGATIIVYVNWEQSRRMGIDGKSKDGL